MTTLDPNWVTAAPEGEPCQRCEGKESVYALKTIFDQPRFLCKHCIFEAYYAVVEAQE